MIFLHITLLYAFNFLQDWDIVIMKPLMKELEDCLNGMRLRSTLQPTLAVFMDQLKRCQLDDVCLDSIGQLLLLISVEQ